MFSPGGEAFDSFCVNSTPEQSALPGVAPLLRRASGGLQFVVATRFGPQRVQTLGELLAALDAVGVPPEFPLADWSGMTVSVVA